MRTQTAIVHGPGHIQDFGQFCGRPTAAFDFVFGTKTVNAEFYPKLMLIQPFESSPINQHAIGGHRETHSCAHATGFFLAVSYDVLSRSSSSNGSPPKKATTSLSSPC